jgi:tetratricopeptide (TPR) repeat protein
MKDAVTGVCDIYERILELKSDYKEAMLYLVEFYGAIPEEMGGDKAKAEEFVIKLEELDRIYGMKARLFILPDETDRIEYWQSKLENNPDNPEIMEELGKDYLFAGNIEKGIDLLEQALELAPEKPTLLLDMARYYLMTMMRGQEPDEKATAKIKELFNRYLETDPISPLKAYALELMAKFYFGLNDNNEADRLRNEAIAVDPYYSKAFGLPPAILFTPPSEISYIHRYHFRPF